MGVIICWVVFAACGVVAALYVYRFSKWVVRLVGAVGLPRPVLAALSVMAVVATLVSGKVPLLSLLPPTLIPDVVDVEQTDDDVPPVTDLRFTAITSGDDAVTLAFAWPESWTFTNGFLDLYGCSDLAAGDWRRLAQVDVSLAGSNAVVTLPHASFPVESMDRMAFFRLASQDDTDGDGLPDKFEDWCFKTDPLLVDSENDGLDDGDEEALGTNPQENDTDGDGLTDSEEAGRISVAPSFEWYDTTGGATCWSSWDPEGGASSGGWSWDAIDGYLSSDVWMDGIGAVVGVQAGRTYLPERGHYNLTWDFARRGPILPQTTVVYRLGTGTDPLLADSDGDGLDDCCELETSFTNPFDDDMDGDGLDDGDEIMLDCDPLEPDSDGDGMFDGWEFDFGFDPDVHNDLTERTDDDGDADPDGDGLDNLAECAAGTNPVGTDSDGDGLPDGWDSDGDGVSDGMELRQSSDPVDSRDGGVAGSRVSVQLRFGDHSDSCSEKYRLSVRPVSGPARDDQLTSYDIVNRDYGECETKTVLLKPGWLYEVRLSHAATKFASTGAVADYDYTLEFPAGWNLPACVVFDDPDGLFDVDETSTSFSGEGKVATFFVPAVPSVSMAVTTIGVNADDDDGDGRMDSVQNGRVANDDDLVEVVVSAFCPEGVSGTASIELRSNSASLWKDRDRTEVVEVVDSFSVSGETRRTYYLEGDAASARHGVDALRASLSVGSASSGTVERHFTVIDRRAEPITTARVDGCIVNPSGAVVGGDSHMQIGVLPADYPDANIHWRVVSGQGTFVGGDTGRNVVFRASGQADETVVLQVDCGDCPGRSPQFTLRTCAVHEVKVYPCAIYSPGETTPITQAHVQELLDEVNVIYRQVGLHFSLGAPLVTRVNDEWDRYGLVNKRIRTELCSALPTTDGVEVYFIKGCGLKRWDGTAEPLGDNSFDGIVIKNRASGIDRTTSDAWCQQGNSY